MGEVLLSFGFRDCDISDKLIAVLARAQGLSKARSRPGRHSNRNVECMIMMCVMLSLYIYKCDCPR